MKTNICLVEKRLTVLNDQGLVDGAAADFARLAIQFESAIRIASRGVRYSAKRIVEVRAARLNFGHTFTVVAEGRDAPEAVAALERLLQHLNVADAVARGMRVRTERSVRDFMME